MDPRAGGLNLVPDVPAHTTAAVWHGGDQVELTRLSVPAPGPGEVLVRVRLATVCGSDLHTVAGRRPSPAPSVLGHEAVGEVVAVGEGGVRTVDGQALHGGDRVVWGVAVSCGWCDRCRAGRTAKCRRLLKVGHESLDTWALSGGYAEHVLLPVGSAVVTVETCLPDEVAAPAACATATVAAVMERAGRVADRRVLVSGAGMLGLTAIAAAVEAGAADVIVVDVDPERLRLAGKFGATRIVPAGEDLPGTDVAIELSGAAPAVAAALASLDVDGTLVIAGSVAPGPAVSLDPERVVRRWLTVAGVHNYEPRHLVAAVGLLERTRDRYPWRDLVADPVALSEVGRLLLQHDRRTPRTAVRP